MLFGASLVFGILAPFAGVAIGYEVSDAAGAEVLPTIAVSEDRATFGVAGSF